MNTALNLLAAVACLAWLGFALLYHAKAAWWATSQGRNIMAVSLALGAFLALAVTARVWPDVLWLDGVRLVVYPWLAYLGIERTVQMLRLQRQVRLARLGHNHRAEHPSSGESPTTRVD